MDAELVTNRAREDWRLPNLVTGPRLREAVERGSFIRGGDVNAVEGVKYDLHMGSRILKAAFGQAVDIERMNETEKRLLTVDPGEVVFVLTKETLSLPSNIVVTLNPKRTLAHSGIVMLGGLSVDPNYTGPLWIGLYNISSTKYVLRPGNKLIAAMFYELEQEELQDFAVPPSSGGRDFPDELITLIQNYRPIELKGLQDEVEDAKRQIVQLRAELTTDRDWRTEFKDGLEKHNHQLGQLIEGLKEERETRRQEDDRIRSKLDSISGTFAGMRVVWVILALVVGALLEWGVPKTMDYLRAASVVTNPPAAPPPSPSPPASPPGK